PASASPLHSFFFIFTDTSTPLISTLSLHDALPILANTAFVGAFVVLITLLAAVPAGYSLARLARGWGQKFGIGIFLTYLVPPSLDRKSTRLNSSHVSISYAVFCLKKKN